MWLVVFNIIFITITNRIFRNNGFWNLIDAVFKILTLFKSRGIFTSGKLFATFYRAKRYFKTITLVVKTTWKFLCIWNSLGFARDQWLVSHVSFGIDTFFWCRHKIQYVYIDLSLRSGSSVLRPRALPYSADIETFK